MVIRFVVVRRKPSMSREDFRAYWRDVHGPLIAKLPGLRRYVQFHVASDLAELADGDRPIDGIAALWFDSAEDQQAAYGTPEYEAVLADEAELFELDSLHVHPVMTEEVVELIAGDGRL